MVMYKGIFDGYNLSCGKSRKNDCQNAFYKRRTIRDTDVKAKIWAS